ncbi:SRPBCC domain-containing protein [Segetibacter sp. 3557_3]|uniref:SRPBCC family protein n=1 Tax=Segetibacter sp. 3557_3 TaxID=2547429 RepID=UPI001058B536|nr:SRPBCC domain-containing protein [Segetibacter sp. 3557_3]TDH21590.1 SRPBCC domain-containing protein [Segetibacter sp. 3557_3]
MTTIKQTEITKDLGEKKLTIIREFNAPVEDVWNAWTDSSILDLWWAPKPWKAITKKMDFREGGFWLYCMEGPDGTQTWAREDYETINPHQGFTAYDAFCDEDGNIDETFPRMHWTNTFVETGSGTTVQVVITLSSEEDLAKILEMGFEEGFTSAHSNLDEVLASQTMNS